MDHCVIMQLLYFSLPIEWKANTDQKGLGEVWSINKVAKTSNEEFDTATLHDKPELAAQLQLVDDGSGNLKVCLN